MTFPAVSGWLGARIPYVAAHPEMPWAIATTAGTIVLLASGSYGLVEWGSTLMVVTFTLVTVACVLMLPFAGHVVVWADVFDGLKFQLPSNPDARMAAFAMFGITGVGAAELISYPYWCIEKGYARKTGPRPVADAAGDLRGQSRVLDDSGSSVDAGWSTRALGWLRVMKLDAWVSMGIYTLATLAFYFLGAAVLHKGDGAGLPTTVDSMMVRLAQMYEPVMGQRLALLFISVGAFAVLYSTLFAATAGNARGFTDAMWVSRMIRLPDHPTRRRWICIFCVTTPLLDLLLYVMFGNPVQMVIVGGFAQAVTLPMIAAAAVFLRYHRTDQRLTAGKVWDTFLWLSFVALCGAAMYGLYDVYGKVMKMMNGG